jgi:hypothetical protein
VLGIVETHKAGWLVPDLSPFNARIFIAKFKKYKLSGSD